MSDSFPPDSSVHGISQARILEWVAIPFSRGIFLTQGSNPGLLHCWWILYHLSHQGYIYFTTIKLKKKTNNAAAEMSSPVGSPVYGLPGNRCQCLLASLATLLSRGPLLKAHLALAFLTCEVSLLVSEVCGSAASGFRPHLEQTLGADVTTSPRTPGNGAGDGL